MTPFLNHPVHQCDLEIEISTIGDSGILMKFREVYQEFERWHSPELLKILDSNSFTNNNGGSIIKVKMYEILLSVINVEKTKNWYYTIWIWTFSGPRYFLQFLSFKFVVHSVIYCDKFETSDNCTSRMSLFNFVIQLYLSQKFPVNHCYPHKMMNCICFNFKPIDANRTQVERDGERLYIHVIEKLYRTFLFCLLKL